MTHDTESQAIENEELLRRVIEAQVKGGFEEYDFLRIDTEVLDTGYVNGHVRSRHILEILLDTQGAKAAYGEDTNNGMTEVKPDQTIGFITPPWYYVANKILDAWHFGEGNNVRAALETAVSFLP